MVIHIAHEVNIIPS